MTRFTVRRPGAAVRTLARPSSAWWPHRELQQDDRREEHDEPGVVHSPQARPRYLARETIARTQPRQSETGRSRTQPRRQAIQAWSIAIGPGLSELSYQDGLFAYSFEPAETHDRREHQSESEPLAKLNCAPRKPTPTMAAVAGNASSAKGRTRRSRESQTQVAQRQREQTGNEGQQDQPTQVPQPGVIGASSFQLMANAPANPRRTAAQSGLAPRQPR
jgi:hypothetical protein